MAHGHDVGLAVHGYSLVGPRGDASVDANSSPAWQRDGNRSLFALDLAMGYGRFGLGRMPARRGKSG